ncbi:MAG TPA: glycosyltransferase family 4 protein [Candidatus Limnocylindrales bacterium]|nr:glycosyltransferase family 4 protein [Candidatus Limnocylindrales bacterium]
MNILILNQYGLPRGAQGITRHGDLGSALVESGHAVTVVASRFNYLTREARATAPHDRQFGVLFRWLSTGTYASNDRRRLASMVSYSVRAVIAGIRTGPRPDVVIGSSPHLLAGLSAAIVAAYHRVPFVFEVRDFWPAVLVDLGALQRGGIVHRILERLESWLYRRARLVVVVPPDGARRLAELGIRTPVAHVPNAASTSTDEAEPVPRSLDAILGAAEGRILIVYTGAHGVANDLPTVVRAATELRSRDPDAYARTAFCLIGDGAQKGSVERFAAAEGHTNFLFHQPIAKAAIPTALARADILLVSVGQSAQGYGLSPNKLFDYMAAGRPVLISADAATVVDAAECGLRYRPGDPSSLATQIERLMSMSPIDRTEMGERGRASVKESYSVAAVARLLEQHLAAVRRS